MRIALTILFLWSVCVGTAQKATLEEARKEFHKAVMSDDKSRPFHRYMENFEDPSAAVLAYQAVSEAMLARVLWNPFSKLTQVRKYQEKIALAVAGDPENIEIRFLRLAIEYNLPTFLGMSEHVEEDVTMIMKNLPSAASLRLDPAYGQYIFYFLEQTDLCTSDQILAMRASIAQKATY